MSSSSSGGGGGASLLPSYQRFAGGLHSAPGQLFSGGGAAAVRRSFRPREKHLILLVFLTFGVVCFGAFFFLPDDFKAPGGVYVVYQHMQRAGPELLMPPAPRAFSPNRHDPRLDRDKIKLQAKIDEEYQNHKVLERPEVLEEPRVFTSSLSSSPMHKLAFEIIETVPPEPSDKLPKIVATDNLDPVNRQRREKVKE
ncbi:hypothetical protein QAD02_012473, partial [Eretmocerus hayati]